MRAMKLISWTVLALGGGCTSWAALNMARNTDFGIFFYGAVVWALAPYVLLAACAGSASKTPTQSVVILIASVVIAGVAFVCYREMLFGYRGWRENVHLAVIATYQWGGVVVTWIVAALLGGVGKARRLD